MIGLDTNVLLRYVTDDDPRQSAVARRFVEQRLSPENPGHVGLVALAESLWVLASRYHVARKDLIKFVEQLLSDPRIVVQGSHAVWLALEVAEKKAIDLPDALITFVNRDCGCSHTVTFDSKAARIPGMILID